MNPAALGSAATAVIVALAALGAIGIAGLWPRQAARIRRRMDEQDEPPLRQQVIATIIFLGLGVLLVVALTVIRPVSPIPILVLGGGAAFFVVMGVFGVVITIRRWRRVDH